MTVIAAFEGEDKYWIASDSQGVGGGTMIERGTKLIKKNNYIVGFTYSYRVADLIRESKNLPADIRNLKDLRKFRDEIKKALTDDKLVGKRTAGDGEHPITVIIISSSGIYEIEADYQIHKIQKNSYAATGSGIDTALGALYSCKKLKVDGKEAVKLAVKSAVEHISSCGGGCHIGSVEKNNANRI